MINSNIIYVKDILQFNGKFMSDIYQRLNDKRHYFRDITLLRKALLPYTNLLHENVPYNINMNQVNIEPTFIEIPPKSNYFYKIFVEKKQLAPKSLIQWQREFPLFSFPLFYEQKLQYMHVIKIKEFLFKVIHHICACNAMLFRWKISDTKSCIYCGNDSQTIKHMLWDCNCVKAFWIHLSNMLKIDISYQLLILGNENKTQNNMLSVILYLIYKKFLNDNDNTRNRLHLTKYIKEELKRKALIFNMNFNTSENVIPLNKIINVL